MTDAEKAANTAARFHRRAAELREAMQRKILAEKDGRDR